MEKIALRQAVIVEGKYDKIRLDALVDALVIPTNGFGIFRDAEMRGFIHKLAHSCGIVVLTDADAAGFRIRNQVAQAARGGEVIHVYTPDIWGKERRKNRPGAEHKLGVEGMETAVLLDAFARSGILPDSKKATGSKHPITRQDLYDLGLNGGAQSSILRRQLCQHLGLPQRLSQSSLLPVLQQMLTLDALRTLVEDLAKKN